MRALVIGSGSTVRADLIEAGRRRFDVRLGVNAAACHFKPVDWHVTMHPREYSPRKAALMVSPQRHPAVDVVFPWRWDEHVTSSGSSSLYAVKFALEYLRADVVILAGVPLDDGPHFNGGPAWGAATGFRKTWQRVAPRLQGRVWSLSGWTRELLGPPPDEEIDTA